MSNITDDASAKVDETAEPSTFDTNIRDGVLTELVYYVNCIKEAVPEGQPVSLFVGGLIVTGELIPNWQWFAEQARGDEDEDPLFGRWAKLTVDQRDADEDRPFDVSDLPSYIHLKHATFLSPPANVNADFYWRGRISRVDGWVLGRLSVGS